MNLKPFLLQIYAVLSISGCSDSFIILNITREAELYIIGGSNAEDGQARFQCSLQRSGGHFCGCAILSSEWIITAAHCIFDKDVSNIQIFLGSYKLSGSGIYYGIDKSILHEDYDSPSNAFDIAVLYVNEPIEFNDKVQPIELSADEVPEGSFAQMTGWGYVNAFGSVPDHLQVISLRVLQTSKCKELLGSTIVHDSHICTYNEAGEGVCDGDSGGPLVYNNKLIGLASWGFICGQGSPEGFAKISYLYDWVKEKIKSQ